MGPGDGKRVGLYDGAIVGFCDIDGDTVGLTVGAVLGL